jgi:acyl dehydratase
MTQWYEEIVVGQPHPLGSHSFTAEEIIRFGRLYDPQYFHLSEADAAHSHFGGLVASGWHTVVIGHRLMVDALFADDELHRRRGEEPGISGPSPGVNRMEFKAPVRPGDVVSYVLTVTSKRPSASLPGWALLINDLVATNERGETVYHAELAGFTKMRDYRMPLRLKILMALTRIPGLGRLLAPRRPSR